ncbi:hypothetical protein HN011_000219 [Eciton burchellii]|nr:hypothetical protein HN011_000219 [Eciton burchellii]
MEKFTCLFNLIIFLLAIHIIYSKESKPKSQKPIRFYDFDEADNPIQTPKPIFVHAIHELDQTLKYVLVVVITIFICGAFFLALEEIMYGLIRCRIRRIAEERGEAARSNPAMVHSDSMIFE